MVNVRVVFGKSDTEISSMVITESRDPLLWLTLFMFIGRQWVMVMVLCFPEASGRGPHSGQRFGDK